MTNEPILEGDWNEIKAKLRQKWSQLTDDDLPQLRVELDQIIGIVQRKTGEARGAIERYLEQVSGSAASAAGTAAETAGEYAQHVAEAVRDTARQAGGQVRAGYDAAERFVCERPKESLAVCFGAGVITGVVIASLLRAR